jgi:hypothetical protein
VPRVTRGSRIRAQRCHFLLFHFDRPLSHVFGQRNGFTDFCVDMTAHYDGGRSDFAAGFMHHLVEHMNGFVPDFQKGGLDRDSIARM